MPRSVSLCDKNDCGIYVFPFQYIKNLGVDESWQFVDIYGLDDELLSMVPVKRAAVMLLYPLTEKVTINDLAVGITVNHDNTISMLFYPV